MFAILVTLASFGMAYLVIFRVLNRKSTQNMTASQRIINHFEISDYRSDYMD